MADREVPDPSLINYAREWRAQIGGLVLDAAERFVPDEVKSSLGAVDEGIEITVRKASWPAGVASRLTIRCYGKDYKGDSNRFSYGFTTKSPHCEGPPPNQK